MRVVRGRKQQGGIGGGGGTDTDTGIGTSTDTGTGTSTGTSTSTDTSIGTGTGTGTGRERRPHRPRRCALAEPGGQERPAGAHFPGFGVHHEPHRMPRTLDERFRNHRHVAHRRSVAERGTERRAEPALLVDGEDESAPRSGAGARGDRLPRACEPRRMDEAGHREAARPEAARRALDARVRPLRRALLRRRCAPDGGCRDRLQEDAGPGGVRVRADDPHDSSPPTSAPVALLRWNRIVSPGRTDRRSAYPVSGSMAKGSSGPRPAVRPASGRYSHRNGR